MPNAEVFLISVAMTAGIGGRLQFPILDYAFYILHYSKFHHFRLWASPMASIFFSSRAQTAAKF